MKKIFILLVSFFTAISIGCSQKLDGKAYLQFTLGSVKITNNNIKIDPVPGIEITAGTTIVTGNKSVAAIQIGQTGLLKITSNSKVDISSLLSTGGFKMFLEQGKALVNISKLLKGQSFKIETPTVLASVRGTRFSVSYQEGRVIVAVGNGKVDVLSIKINESKIIIDEQTVVIENDFTEREISKIEVIELERVSEELVIKDIKKSDIKKESDILIKKEKEIKKQIDKKRGMLEPEITLAILKKKYGRIDIVTLYNGKRYSGVILKRGVYTSMITTAGKIRIKSVQIRTTSVK